VAIGDAETMIPPVSDQMPAPAFNDVEPAGFHPAVSSPAMHRSSMDEEYYHSPMPSPPQQQPEQVPEQTYAGLNYSGDVAIGGIAVGIFEFVFFTFVTHWHDFAHTVVHANLILRPTLHPNKRNKRQSMRSEWSQKANSKKKIREKGESF
jgi:hypothetical protein